MAVKRREQTLQDYKRLQSKVEKYEEKERTGPVLAKLHQVLRRPQSHNPSRILGKTQEFSLLSSTSRTFWEDAFYLCKKITFFDSATLVWSAR